LPLIQKGVPHAKIVSEEGQHFSTSMQDILQAIEKYLIGAMPTAALFIVLVIAYQFLVQGPLTAMLAKRRALTEGAMEDARKAVDGRQLLHPA
jgi:F0F1-type ATP synthase membrane subunit b/b'